MYKMTPLIAVRQPYSQNMRDIPMLWVVLKTRKPLLKMPDPFVMHVRYSRPRNSTWERA